MPTAALFVLILLAWAATIALAFAAGRAVRPSEPGRTSGSSAEVPTVLRVPSVDGITHVSGPPGGAVLIPTGTAGESWQPKRERTTIPVRGSDWRSSRDLRREAQRRIAVALDVPVDLLTGKPDWHRGI